MDLSQVEQVNLLRELDRRQKIEEKKWAEREEDEHFEAWLNRPECAVTGRAYGYPGGCVAREYELATLIIKGNMSWSYPVSLTVAPSVEIYLHNALLDRDRAELKRGLTALAKKFILKKCADPAIVTTLICLSENAGWQPLNERGRAIYEGWHKEAVSRLLLYSLEELQGAKTKLLLEHETAHGQIRLLDEVIKIKSEAD